MSDQSMACFLLFVLGVILSGVACAAADARDKWKLSEKVVFILGLLFTAPAIFKLFVTAVM